MSSGQPIELVFIWKSKINKWEDEYSCDLIEEQDLT